MIPDPPDENGVRCFGSAKDEKGTLLADVAFLLQTKQSSFTFITGKEGRFRGSLPRNTPFAEVTARCWKDGLETVRVTKRPGPSSVKQPMVEVDCILRPMARD